MAQIIPLSTAPNQLMRITLLVDGNQTILELGFSFNTALNVWVMSVSDRNSNLLISCVPLLTGVWPAANILAPYAYMQLGSAFVINTDGQGPDNPDDSTLGSDFVLLWDDTPMS